MTTLLKMILPVFFAGFINSNATAQAAYAGKPGVPAELITNDSTYWTINTLSTIGYVNNTPGAYYNTYKSGGGMTVKFKFKKDGRYEFMLYVQLNTYGIENETWTYTEGNVEFTTDAKGQNIFITHPEKGNYRIVKNGKVTARTIPKSELGTQHSTSYLWEKTMLKDDTKNVYLLIVDLKQHPDADINNPGTIQPDWVSKFHIPAK